MHKTQITVLTSRMFSSEYKGKSLDGSDIVFNIDYVKLFKKYIKKYVKIESENITCDEDIVFYLSYEEHLRKNETYKNNEALIQVVMDKAGGFIANMISSNIGGEKMEAVFEKLSPMLKFFS